MRDAVTKRVENSATAVEKPMHTADAITADLSTKVREMVGDYDGLKSGWARVARSCGLTDRQIRRLHYREWPVVPAHVYFAVLRAYRNHLERAEAQMLHQAAIVRARAEEYDQKWQELSARGSISRSSDTAPTSNGARSE
jgi:hypothetical protein